MNLLEKRGQRPDSPLFDVGDVLLDELQFIRLRRNRMKPAETKISQEYDTLSIASGDTDTKIDADTKLAKYLKAVHDLRDLSALCLSGGGIRSAAFSLGVLQGLAARKILPQFDYLSTVSGGGYTGAFLTAWGNHDGFDAVCDDLTGSKVDRPATDRSPLRHLRRYSSYLAPRIGPFTTDMLTIVALYLRNLFLNWLILIPLIIFLIVAVKMLAVVIWQKNESTTALALLALFAITLIGLSVLDLLQRRPGWESERAGPTLICWHETWLLLGSVAASWAALKYMDFGQPVTPRLIFGLAAISGFIHVIAWMMAFFIARPPDKKEISTRETVRTAGWRDAVLTLAVFAISGALVGGLLGSMIWQLNRFSDKDLLAFMVLCFGPPIVMGALFLGETLHLGFTSYVKWGDGEREWLARAAGYHARTTVSWMLFTVVVLGGSYVAFDLSKNWMTFAPVISAGGIAGVVATVLGKASTTAATIRQRYETWKTLGVAVLIAVATIVFIAITISLLSAGIDALVGDKPLSYGSVNAAADDTLWIAFIAILLSMSVTFTLASLAINPNRFSLHGVYRNRLIRAFLGAPRAARKERSPNPFTDFDEKDNINLSDLWPNDPGNWPRPHSATDRKTSNPTNSKRPIPPPFSVMNCALNILATRELAWQERKALSFTVTPRSVGSGALNEDQGCYRRANEYGAGISLGTAMALSGAAASPNMGYHSSAALSLLLTFFNVRLGAWLGNPGPAGATTYRTPGPTFAAEPLVQEALGLTTEENRYVYLSDGGHFENLGLYEMVRRRCHCIVVSDASCDPHVKFEDLGNAVRKISIDMNVKIEFEALKISARTEPPTEGTYCAVARLLYPEPTAAPGFLLYIKPGYHGVEFCFRAQLRGWKSGVPARVDA